MEARPTSMIPRNRPRTCQPRSQSYQSRSPEYLSFSFNNESSESELSQQLSQNSNCGKSTDDESSCGIVHSLEEEDECEESEWIAEDSKEQMLRPESRLGFQVFHKRPGTAPIFKKRWLETDKKYSDRAFRQSNGSEGLADDEYEYEDFVYDVPEECSQVVDSEDPDELVDRFEIVSWKKRDSIMRSRRPDLVHFQPVKPSSTSVQQRRSLLPPSHGNGLRYRMPSSSSPKIVQFMLERAGFRRSRRVNTFDLLWVPAPVPSKRFETLNSSQRINHFPNSIQLAKKDFLYNNLKRMRRLHGRAEFDFLPETYVMPAERDALQSAFFRTRDNCSTGQQNDNLWIVKAVHSSQGKGVFVTDKLRQIPTNANVLVSRYIGNPLLIDRKKCDLRIYVLVTSFDPIRVYAYDEGLVRIASEPYTTSPDCLTNRYVHLTNSSVNKSNPNYFVSDDPSWHNVGNKRTFTGLRRHLRQQGKDPGKLFERIHDIIMKTIWSVEMAVSQDILRHVPSRHNCFEIFGFDVLVDSQMKPWLLEVNQCPSLKCEAGLDLQIKSSMLSDAFNMLSFKHKAPVKKGLLQHTRSTHQLSQQEREWAKKPVYSTMHPGLCATQSRMVPKSSLTPYRGRTDPLLSHMKKKKKKVYKKKEVLSEASCPSVWLWRRDRNDPLAKQLEKEILTESRNENERRGRFVRLYPTANWKRYSHFMQNWKFRHLNEMLCKHCKDDQTNSLQNYVENPPELGEDHLDLEPSTNGYHMDHLIGQDINNSFQVFAKQSEDKGSLKITETTVPGESDQQQHDRIMQALRLRFGMQYTRR